MRIIIKLTSYLKWVGLFGFFGFIFDSQLWKILWGFWIFGFFELLFTLPIFIQSLGQLFAMFAIPLKNNPVPSVSNYKSDIQYSLPFKGKWTVANGGVDKELSYSWSINAHQLQTRKSSKWQKVQNQSMKNR